MGRVAIPLVEVITPDGTTSLWAVALPHKEAVAAIRRIIPSDHIAQLSIRRLQRRPALDRLRRGEIRKIEATTPAKSPGAANQPAMAIVDIAKARRTGASRTLSEYRAYAVGSDGEFIGVEMICRDDGEAVASAKRLMGDCDVELWNGNRFVIRLVHRLK